jgi:hypothetical protein
MMTSAEPRIISACSFGDGTEILIVTGDGDTLAEFEIPRALLDVDALADRFAAGAGATCSR